MKQLGSVTIFAVIVCACGLGNGTIGNQTGGANESDEAVLRLVVDGGNCSPSNCQGCCRDGLCLAGRSNANCGIGGDSCSRCDPALSLACVQGACEEVSTCDEHTCPNGCCAAGVCVRGNSNANCGFGGQQCARCFSQSGEYCVAQSCELVMSQCTNQSCSAPTPEVCRAPDAGTITGVDAGAAVDAGLPVGYGCTKSLPIVQVVTRASQTDGGLWLFSSYFETDDSPMRRDWLLVKSYSPTTIVEPRSIDLASSSLDGGVADTVSYAQCTRVTCPRAYLARSGTMHIAEQWASPGLSAGTPNHGVYQGRLEDVVLAEYDFTDGAWVANGGCVSLPNMTFGGAF